MPFASPQAEILAMMNYESKTPEALEALNMPPSERREGIAIIDVDPESANFGKILADIPMPPDQVVHHIFYDQTMTKAYVTSLGSPSLQVMDMTQFPYRLQTIEVEGCAMGEDVIFDEANQRWYLTCMQSGHVFVGDVATDEVLTRIDLPGSYPHIRELIADTSSIISELKAVAMDLRPSFLENAELTEAVKWHAGRVQEKSGIPIHMQIMDSVKVSPKLKDNIYRIFQEALSNVVQHSGANSVDIILCIKGNNVILEVKDNGTGFQLIQERDGEKGLGLYTIKERVELLGGAMRIRSSVQKGTCLSIEVPLE